MKPKKTDQIIDSVIVYPFLMFFDVRGLRAKPKDFQPLTPEDVKDLVIYDPQTDSFEG
jgi:hypothetical protein